MTGSHTLMHKDKKVAEIKFDKHGFVQSISKVHSKDLLPLCIKDKTCSSNASVYEMQRWVMSRNLSMNRKDLTPLREFYGGTSFETASGISLFDTYWFAEPEFDDWEQINPFDNWNHKEDSMFFMLMCPEKLEDISLDSPNLCIPGDRQRLWFRDRDNSLILLHGEAQKEVASYKKAGKDKNVIERNYCIIAGHIFAKTLAYTSKNVECISLEDLYLFTEEKELPKMKNLERCCEHFGIENWQDFIHQMMKYDEIIENNDRELSDVGVLRDANTLEIIGFAPL